MNDLNICNLQGSFAAVAAVGGAATASTTTGVSPFVQECEAILQVNDNPAFISVADLQFLVDNASLDRCDDKPTLLLVEPIFVELAMASSCGICVDEDGSDVLAADGSALGCCGELVISVDGLEGDTGSDLCTYVRTIILLDCLTTDSDSCVPSQFPDCVDAADACRDACPFTTYEETFSCVDTCVTLWIACSGAIGACLTGDADYEGGATNTNTDYGSSSEEVGAPTTGATNNYSSEGGASGNSGGGNGETTAGGSNGAFSSESVSSEGGASGNTGGGNGETTAGGINGAFSSESSSVSVSCFPFLLFLSIVLHVL